MAFLIWNPKSESESEVAQSCLTLRDPMDYSLSGSSAQGIFQARVLEWAAISFSNIWNPKDGEKDLSSGLVSTTNLLFNFGQVR